MIINKTKSLCPNCLSVIYAEVYKDKEKIMIKKECKEHGNFDNIYWGPLLSDELYKKASKSNFKGEGVENPHTDSQYDCPLNCGLCSEHESQTVMGLIDVTNRCDLNCSICFANASRRSFAPNEDAHSKRMRLVPNELSKHLYEPSYEKIREMLRNLKKNKPVPTPAIQYAGGEPTLREDIVDLIKLAKEEGFEYIQIATNGLRLARDSELAKKLMEAGLSVVYLQFDGVTEEPYLKIRNKNLLETKLKAIENCRKVNLCIVLVPTIVKGINDHQIGDIIRFAAENIDIIRCVNFQLISFTGRTLSDEVEKQRITIPDFENLVEKQTNSKIKVEDFYPASSVVPISEFIEAIEGTKQVSFTCHPHCGVATYIFIKDGEIIPITHFIDVDRFFNLLSKSAKDIKKGGIIEKVKTITMATIEISRTIDTSKAPDSVDIKNLLISVFKERSYSALENFHYNALLIACMHFMDPWNFDCERVRRCVIHYAVPDGRIIPFCSMNVLYREEIEKKFAVPIKNKKLSLIRSE